MTLSRPSRYPLRLCAPALAALLLCLGPGNALARTLVPRLGAASSRLARSLAHNPLELHDPPGENPLTGARFYVPGPAQGAAAGAIAQLLGLNPAAMNPAESWATFEASLRSGPLHDRLVADPTLARQVSELSLVATEPQVQRVSDPPGFRTPQDISEATTQFVSLNLADDPGTVPILATDFLHVTLGGCPTPAAVSAYLPLFEAQVNAMTAAVGSHRAVFLLELDAIGSSHCLDRAGAMPEWEAALRYEAHAVAALPHTVVYLEGGYSDATSPRYAARILNAVGVRSVRGFYVNGTHEMWTSTEDRYGRRISRLTGGAHFIVNTADNGRGPLLNPHPRAEGVEDLCNPPGRGTGIRDTTDTGVPRADAYLWTHPPGGSSGSCNGGPPGGVFWPARAEAEAALASNQFGPGRPVVRYFSSLTFG